MYPDFNTKYLCMNYRIKAIHRQHLFLTFIYFIRNPYSKILEFWVFVTKKRRLIQPDFAVLVLCSSKHALEEAHLAFAFTFHT